MAESLRLDSSISLKTSSKITFSSSDESVEDGLSTSA